MNILFVHNGMTPFIRKDLDILAGRYNVRTCEFRQNWYTVGLSLLYMWMRVRSADVTFSWFGKLHAFFAVFFSRILGKKSVVVAGGDDVARMPHIRYGMFFYWWKKWCPLYVFNNATLVLTVSEHTTRETVINTGAAPSKIRCIGHGFRSDMFRRTVSAKEKAAVTIGNVSWEYLRRKGIALFVRAAQYLPDIPFYLIGEWRDDAIRYLRGIASDNMKFIGKAEDKVLREYLDRAKVYVQVSSHEGFGCALAEAMLCECIPVVSRKGAIPEVAGDTGIYADILTPASVADRIAYAMSLSDAHGAHARARIIKNYGYKERADNIIQAMEALW